MEEETRKCFVIMPISDVDGYDKGHFTRVYEYLIKPAVESAGYEADIATDTSKANFIVVDILQKILACDIAICDLSSRNPNVFYELGIRQAFNKKTVLICDDRTQKPFDTSGIRTLPYSASLRIDEVKRSIPALTQCINETISPDNRDVNSLIELLSIQKPATLPNKISMSPDLGLILNAIEDLNMKINNVRNNTDTTNIINGDYTQLPNGQYVIDGAKLYFEGDEIGRFVTMDKSSLTVMRIKQGNTQKVRYKLTDDFLSKLSITNPRELPF